MKSGTTKPAGTRLPSAPTEYACHSSPSRSTWTILPNTLKRSGCMGCVHCKLSLGLSGDVLRDTPQHAAGIEQREVPHGPRPILWFADPDTEAPGHRFRLLVPVADVLDEQMH